MYRIIVFLVYMMIMASINVTFWPEWASIDPEVTYEFRSLKTGNMIIEDSLLQGIPSKREFHTNAWNSGRVQPTDVWIRPGPVWGKDGYLIVK